MQQTSPRTETHILEQKNRLDKVQSNYLTSTPPESPEESPLKTDKNQDGEISTRSENLNLTDVIKFLEFKESVGVSIGKKTTNTAFDFEFLPRGSE